MAPFCPFLLVTFEWYSRTFFSRAGLHGGSGVCWRLLRAFLAVKAGVDFFLFELSGAGVPETDLELLVEVVAAPPLRVVAGIELRKCVAEIKCLVGRY